MRSVAILLVCLTLAACQASPKSPAQETTSEAELSVLAAETFLADIAQNVAGERVAVESILPLELDPHTYEPTPQDLVKIAEGQVLIVNGAGFEFWMDELIENSGGEQLVVQFEMVDGNFTEVFLQGAARMVFEGKLQPEALL